MAFKGDLREVPVAPGMVDPYLGGRFRIEVASCEAGDTSPHLDEALSLPRELRATFAPGETVRHDTSDHLALRMSEDSCLGERFAKGQRDAGHVTNGKHVGGPRLERMPVDRHPATCWGQPGGLHYRWYPMRRDVGQQVVVYDVT